MTSVSRFVAVAAASLATLTTVTLATATAAHAGGSQVPKCVYVPTPVTDGYLSDLLCRRDDGTGGFARFVGPADTDELVAVGPDSEDVIASRQRTDGYYDADGEYHGFDVWEINTDLVSAADMLKELKNDIGYTHAYIDAMGDGSTLIADWDKESKKKH